MASPDDNVVVEVFGEGKTDVGHDPRPQRPTKGVVPILLHRLCGEPESMRVKRYRIPYLQQEIGSKGLHKKVEAAKKLAYRNRSHAAVFVVDSEGGGKELKKKHNDLRKGRDFGLANFPMAVGVAHPCIESWLLADGTAIRRALNLPKTPAVPNEPEELPAPRQDPHNSPKEVLRRLTGATTKELPTKDKDKIAAAMNDMDLVRTRCPLGFAPFAGEVQQRIAPLF